MLVDAASKAGPHAFGKPSSNSYSSGFTMPNQHSTRPKQPLSITDDPQFASACQRVWRECHHLMSYSAVDSCLTTSAASGPLNSSNLSLHFKNRLSLYRSCGIKLEPQHIASLTKQGRLWSSVDLRSDPRSRHIHQLAAATMKQRIVEAEKIIESSSENSFINFDSAFSVPPSGLGVDGTQFDFKQGLTVTGLHDHIADAMAINHMLPDSTGLSVWISFSIHDLLKRCKTMTRKRDLLSKLYQHFAMSNRFNFTDLLLEMLSLRILPKLQLQLPGDTVCFPSNSGCCLAVLSLGESIVQIATLVGASPQGIERCLSLWQDFDPINRHCSLATTQFLPLFFLIHFGNWPFSVDSHTRSQYDLTMQIVAQAQKRIHPAILRIEYRRYVGRTSGNVDSFVCQAELVGVADHESGQPEGLTWDSLADHHRRDLVNYYDCHNESQWVAKWQSYSLENRMQGCGRNITFVRINNLCARCFINHVVMQNHADLYPFVQRFSDCSALSLASALDSRFFEIPRHCSDLMHMHMAIHTHPLTLFPLITDNIQATDFVLPSNIFRESDITTSHPRRTRAKRSRCAAAYTQEVFITNYPPAAESSTSFQSYSRCFQTGSVEHSLNNNCAQLGLFISDSSGRGKGLFAQVFFNIGDCIGFMWGKMISRELWNKMVFEFKLDPTQREGEEDYCAPLKLRPPVLRAIHITPSLDGRVDTLVNSCQCPLAYVNSPYEHETPNAEICFPSSPFELNNGFQYVQVRALAAITPGQEILVDYHW